MKKSLLKILCVILLCGTAFSDSYSQQYLPIGATWHYKTSDNFAQNYKKLVVENDTSLVNRLAKRVVEYNSRGNKLAEYYLLQEGRKILKYDETQNDFFTLYDFALEQGDSYILQGYPGNEVVNIDSSGTFNLNGNSRKFQTSSYNSICCTFSGPIIEGIGNLWHFFPIGDFTDVVALRCYSDPLVGEINFLEEDCEFISGIKESDFQEETHFFPNPFVSYLEYSGEFDQILMMDVSGRILITINNTEDLSEKLGILPSGTYLARVSKGKSDRIIPVIKLSE